MAKLSKADQAEKDKRDDTYRTLLTVQIFSLLTTAFWCGTIVAGIYVGIYCPIEISAGKETAITFAIKWIGDLSLDAKTSYVVAAGCAGYAWKLRRQCLRERTEKDRRIKELETKLDPSRSSSDLDVRGKPVTEPKK